MRTLQTPIAITGTGACCNLGSDQQTIARALRDGTGGQFSTVETAKQYNARCHLGGLFPGDLSNEAVGIDRRGARFMGRASRIALKAARMAIAEAGVDARRVAVVFGSGVGDVDTFMGIHDALEQTGNMRKVRPTVIPRIMSSTVSANLINALGATGPSVTAAAACAGGAWHLAIAAMLLDSGHADIVLAGGVECWDTCFHAGFDSMRAYNAQDNDKPERASRPYAADRAGFIMGEGSGAVILERLEDAEARGAAIRGRLLGWGLSSDGTGDMVAPSSGGAARAMRQALAHAGLSAKDVGYINTHGTSTPAGDVMEVGAIREVFPTPVPYSSTKSTTGHTISAAGALEAIFTWWMLADGWLAPSINASPLDPALHDYPPLLESASTDAKVAISNSFGFGGTNVTLVLGAG